MENEQYADLNTAEAARILNVSESYVSRLLDESKLPLHSVGSERRVRLSDVQEYKRHQDAVSEAALRELQAETQELGC